MGKTCCLTFCQETDKDKSKATKFHLFPLNKSYCKKWIDYVHKYDNKEFVATQYSVICSKHFKKNDYETVNGRRTLRAGAYPKVINKIKGEQTTPCKNNDPNNESATSTLSLSSNSSTNSITTNIQETEKKKNKLTFALGGIIEAKDLGTNIWYSVRILEVDWVEKEILIHPENKPQGFDEWIPMDSPRLRPKSSPPKHTRFVKGEQVLATWIDAKKYPAVVEEVHLNERYEVVYFDGIRKTLKSSKLTKLSQNTSSIQLPEKIKKTIDKKFEKKGVLKKRKVKLGTDSTNSIPLSNSPEGKSSIKRTGNGVNANALPSPSKKIKTLSPVQKKSSTPPSTSTISLEPITKTETDQVFQIGKIAIQKKDHSFICPKEGCGKLLRNENILLMHLKHSHTEYNDMLGSTPNVADLAYARTVGQSLYIENRPPNEVVAQTPNVLTTSSINSPELLKDDSKKRRIKENTDQKESAVKEIPKESTGIKTLYPVHRPDTTYGSSSPLSPEQVLEMQEAERRASAGDSKTISHPSPSENKEEKRSSGKRSFPDFVTENINPKKRKIKEIRPEITTTALAEPPSSCIETSIIIEEENTLNDIINQKEPIPDKTEEDFNELSPIIQTCKDSENELCLRNSPDHLRKEEVIHCRCGYEEEDGLMIQCDICLCWQHGACMGIERDFEVPEKYFCITCKNPYRGRRSSLRFFNDQEWLNHGRLPSLNYPNPKVTLSLQERNLFYANKNISKDLLESWKKLRNIRKKIDVSRNKDHPKLYYWNEIWMSPKDFSSLYQDKIKNSFNDTLKNCEIESSLKNSTNSIKRSISSYLSPQLTEKLLNTSSSTLNAFLMELLYEDQSDLQRNHLLKFDNERKKHEASLMPKIINKITNSSPKINSLKTSDELNELKNNTSINNQKIDSSFDKIHNFHEKQFQPEKYEERTVNSEKHTDKNKSNDFINDEIKDSEKDILKTDQDSKEIFNENTKEITIEINSKENEQKDETTTSDEKKIMLKQIGINQEDNDKKSFREIPKDKEHKKNNSESKEIRIHSPNVVSLRSKLKNSLVKTSNNKVKQQSKITVRNSLFTNLKNKKTKVKNKEFKSYNTRYKSNEDHNNFKEINSNPLKEANSSDKQNLNSSGKQNLSELSIPKSSNTEDKQPNQTNCKKSLFNNIKNKKIKVKSKKIKSCNLFNKDNIRNSNEKETALKSLSESAKQNNSSNSKTEQKMDNHKLSKSTHSEDNLSNFRNKQHFSNKSSPISLNNLSIKNLEDLCKFISPCNVSEKDLFCDHCIAGRYYIRKGLSNPIPLKSPSILIEKTPYHKQVITKEKNDDNNLDLEEESCFSDDSTSSLVSEDLCKGHLSYLKQIYEEMDSHKLKNKNPDRNDKQSPITSKQSDIKSKEKQYFEQTKNLQKSPSTTKPSEFDSVAKANLENKQVIKEAIRRENGEEKNIRELDGDRNDKDSKVLLSNLLSSGQEAPALLHQVFLKNRLLSNSNPLLKSIFQHSGFSSDLVRLASSKSSASSTGHNFPIPERMIDSNECRLHLIMHIEQQQLLLLNNLKFLEERITVLENTNSLQRIQKYECNDSTSQKIRDSEITTENESSHSSSSMDLISNSAKIRATLQMLFNDLKKIQDLGDIVSEDISDQIR